MGRHNAVWFIGMMGVTLIITGLLISGTLQSIEGMRAEAESMVVESELGLLAGLQDKDENGEFAQVDTTAISRKAQSMINELVRGLGN